MSREMHGHLSSPAPLRAARTNSIIQDSLCQEGEGWTSSGASLRSIHFRPLRKVLGWFQTSALEAESWPPLAKEVSIAAWA